MTSTIRKPRLIGITGGLLMVALLVTMVALLPGCAVRNLPDNATPAEIRAARCADTEIGLATVTIGLRTATTKAQRQYWARYLKGVQEVIDLYCPADEVTK